MMFKKLAQQLRLKNEEQTCSKVRSCFPMSSPQKSLEEATYNAFLKSMSKNALNLYERQLDVNNFTELALSNPENTTHNQLVENLFAREGIANPFEDEAIFELSENKRFLDDLGL